MSDDPTNKPKGGGDVTVPLTAPSAYRMWSINYKWIHTHDAMTPPGTPWEAVCSNMYGSHRDRLVPHTAPDLDCSCGFYLLDKWSDLKEYNPQPDGVLLVYSETYYWGRVIYHKQDGGWGGAGNNVSVRREGYDGIRAELVYPKHIYFSEAVHDNEWAIGVVEKYGVAWSIEDWRYHVESREERESKKYTGKVLTQSDKRRIRSRIRALRVKVGMAATYTPTTQKRHAKELEFWLSLKTW